MAEERIQRRLVAILAADVVGYSRLMGEDESNTLAQLKARRKDILEPLVAQHQGRIFKSTGDGVLVEFNSAVNAVQCAVDFQQRMTVANADLPEARHIVWRIGVNLGDVIVEDSDLYGDGVNIAARLEGIAEAGGILVSGTVYDYVKNKAKVDFEELGTQGLKNIAEPVRIYRVADTPRVDISTPKAATDKPSIAVLPFANMSSDPEQRFLSDGITEDIIIELSRWRQIQVLSSHASFGYRDRNIDIKRVGRALGVRNVLEGSVRKVGERIRITTQLIDTASGNHVWAERYDRNAEEIFAVQDDVVRTIVGTLVGRVQALNVELTKRKIPANFDAYDCVLRGNALPWSELAAAEAKRLYERAIELDPNYSLAHALLALMVCNEWDSDHSGSNALLERALELAKRAVELDENESMGYYMLGFVHLKLRVFDLAEEYYRRAAAMNPSNPVHNSDMGFLLSYLGQPEEAIWWLEKAKQVDPYFEPAWHWHHWGIALFEARRYDEAIRAFKRPPTTAGWIHAYMGACHAHAGRLAEARQCVGAALRASPYLTITRWSRKEPFKDRVDLDHLLDGLRKAGLPE